MRFRKTSLSGEIIAESRADLLSPSCVIPQAGKEACLSNTSMLAVLRVVAFLYALRCACLVYCYRSMCCIQ